jgi:magnesium-transporting ATPase (P-type)
LCICDKTGTLTKNELTLVKIYTDNKIFNLQPVKEKKTDEIRFSPKSVTLIREHLDSNEARNA